jgi:hypothetical protein
MFSRIFRVLFARAQKPYALIEMNNRYSAMVSTNIAHAVKYYSTGGLLLI